MNVIMIFRIFAITFVFMAPCAFAGDKEAAALEKMIKQNAYDAANFIYQNYPPTDDPAILRQFIAHLLQTATEVLPRLESSLSQEDIKNIYNSDVEFQELAQAPVILFPQSHIDREGILNNYKLMTKLLNNDVQIVLESITPDEEVELLPVLLGQIAFIDDLPNRPNMVFGSEQAIRLRMHYESIAMRFTSYLRKIGAKFPLRDVRTKGWDVRGAEVDERNRCLLQTTLDHLSRKRRVIVHLGGAHAPNFYRNQIISGSSKASAFSLLVGEVFDIFSEVNQKALCALLPPASIRQFQSVAALHYGLPKNTIELAPISIAMTLPRAAVSAKICAACQKPADKICSRCKEMHYCSADCQRSHWPSHKASCKPKH